jgi:hypothetical protein
VGADTGFAGVDARYIIGESKLVAVLCFVCAITRKTKGAPGSVDTGKLVHVNWRV